MVSVLLRNKRSILLGFLVAFYSISYSQEGWAQEPGEQIFNKTCFACHTIGGGQLVGPDLVGVHERRSQEWLERFVISSQSMINAGDAEAVALFEEFNRLPMPDSFLSEEQSRQVLSYIKSKSANQATTPTPSADVQAVPVEPASEEDILAGQELFQGNLRFVNGGPACNACHEVRNDAVIGGGILATELTSVFSRMGGAGVTAILGRAPFPVMQAAYEDRSLTEQEVTALVAFLEYADSEQYNQLPRDYGLGLFASGIVGAGVLFGLFAFVWRGRKNGSVNQSIYDRQIKSSLDDTV
ncbi:MAG: c-type cytochrome [Gammaproteobacteria bacterium]|nr:c-type cytochrome [Gammaproteobacteria bacterium]